MLGKRIGNAVFSVPDSQYSAVKPNIPPLKRKLGLLSKRHGVKLP